MTYINHLNQFLAIAKKDQRLSCSHFSMYIALFYIWNGHRFSNPFHINRDEIMAISHIGSKSTYSKVLDELHAFGYIRHEKPKSKFWKSRITMKNFAKPAHESQLELFTNAGAFLQKKQGDAVPKMGHLKSEKVERLPSRNQDANCPKTGTPAVPVLGRPIYKDIKEIIKREKDSTPTQIIPLKKSIMESSQKQGAAGGQKCIPHSVKKVQPAYMIASLLRMDYSYPCKPCNPCILPKPVASVGQHDANYDSPIPTINEVNEFFKTLERDENPSFRGIGGEGAKFFAHYSAIGWKLGGTNPILDWKAAARKWILNCWRYSGPNGSISKMPVDAQYSSILPLSPPQPSSSSDNYSAPL